METDINLLLRAGAIKYGSHFDSVLIVMTPILQALITAPLNHTLNSVEVFWATSDLAYQLIKLGL